MLTKPTWLRKTINYHQLFNAHENLSGSMTINCYNAQLQILIKICRLRPVIWLTVSGANRFNAFHSHEAEALRVWPKWSLSVTKSHKKKKKESQRPEDWVHIFPLEKYEKYRQDSCLWEATRRTCWWSTGQTSKGKRIMNFYGLHWGYLKTSYFGSTAQWPLLASVCRGEPVKRPEAHINIA